MDMENPMEEQIQLNAAIKVSDSFVYDRIKCASPFLAHMMLDKYVDFLKNKDFDLYERKVLLVQFIETQKDLDVIHEVMSKLKGTEVEDDYKAVFLEHAFKQSSSIARDIVRKSGNGALVDNAMNNIYNSIEDEVINKNREPEIVQKTIVNISGSPQQVMQQLLGMMFGNIQKEEGNGDNDGKSQG